MKILVSVDRNWGIGYKGELLQRIPEDMKFFKRMTMGKVVVMGRGTFESLPGKQPLKDRINIVLSKNLVWDDERVIICRTIEELLQELNKYPAEDVYNIGGESVFKQLFPYCTEAYITRIDHTYPADKYFFNIENLPDWKLESAGEWQNYEGIRYRFERYVRQQSSRQAR